MCFGDCSLSKNCWSDVWVSGCSHVPWGYLSAHRQPLPVISSNLCVYRMLGIEMIALPATKLGFPLEMKINLYGFLWFAVDAGSSPWHQCQKCILKLRNELSRIFLLGRFWTWNAIRNGFTAQCGPAQWHWWFPEKLGTRLAFAKADLIVVVLSHHSC